MLGALQEKCANGAHVHACIVCRCVFRLTTMGRAVCARAMSCVSCSGVAGVCSLIGHACGVASVPVMVVVADSVE